MIVPEAPRLLILADDLSGAADCGVACASVGLATLVLLDPAAAAPGEAEALAVDLDSRGLGAEAAGAAVRAAAARLLSPTTLFYAKIDSTLRGSPAAEIAAARVALAACHAGARRTLAVVAPAFPAMGRTVRDGRVLVHGVPLERTEIWRREGPGAEPDLAAALEAAGLPSRVVPLATVRAGPLAATLRQAMRDGLGAVLCDAETDADLASVAAAGARLDAAIAWAGSAGLARHLSRRFAPAGGSARVEVRTMRRSGPLLAVIGSMSTVARTQCAALAAEPRCQRVAVGPDSLLAGPSAPGWGAAERALEAGIEAAAEDGVILLTVDPEAGTDATPRRGVSAALAKLAAARVDRVGALLVGGGDTAREFLMPAGIAGLRLLGEIEPGVPLALAVGRQAARPLPVVTKAGAFGDARTLIRCVQALRGLPRQEADA
jgi:uncharacterized protein YgbK (DUF1537 family)